MREALPRLLFGLAVVLLVLVVAASAQDFQRSYRLAAGDQINIRNVSGDVRVTGYDGAAILVTGFKEGPDRELVQIEDRSSSNRVDVRVRYPDHCHCNASVRFEVQVPRTINYHFDQLSSVSGDIEVTSLTGTLNVKSVSGDVRVKDVTGPVSASAVSGSVRVEEVVGLVNAKSVSGDVEVAISQLEGAGKMEFSSTSGSVSVRLPAQLDAEVSMSTLSGSLICDFPLQIEERGLRLGRSANGRVGSGLRTLRISSVSGSVSLKHY